MVVIGTAGEATGVSIIATLTTSSSSAISDFRGGGAGAGALGGGIGVTLITTHTTTRTAVIPITVTTATAMAITGMTRPTRARPGRKLPSYSGDWRGRAITVGQLTAFWDLKLVAQFALTNATTDTVDGFFPAKEGLAIVDFESVTGGRQQGAQGQGRFAGRLF